MHNSGASRRGIERAHVFSCLKIVPSRVLILWFMT
jgi:hypothetical protein